MLVRLPQLMKLNHPVADSYNRAHLPFYAAAMQDPRLRLHQAVPWALWSLIKKWHSPSSLRKSASLVWMFAGMHPVSPLITRHNMATRVVTTLQYGKSAAKSSSPMIDFLQRSRPSREKQRCCIWETTDQLIVHLPWTFALDNVQKSQAACK